MGIDKEKGLKNTAKEVKRQFDNTTRAAHTRFRETRFLWDKKDATPEGSKKVDELQTLSDIEKELDRLKNTAPIRPPERLSYERWKELEKLGPDRIKKYAKHYKDHTMDKLKLKLDKLGKSVTYKQYDGWSNKERKKYNKKILRYEAVIHIKKLQLENNILKKQISDMEKSINKVQNIKEKLNILKDETNKINEKQKWNMMRNYKWFSKSLTSDELVKKTGELEKYFKAKIARREIRIEEIEELLHQEIYDKGEEKGNNFDKQVKKITEVFNGNRVSNDYKREEKYKKLSDGSVIESIQKKYEDTEKLLELQGLKFGNVGFNNIGEVKKSVEAFSIEKRDAIRQKEEEFIEPLEPKPRIFFRDFKLKNVLDFVQRADDFYKAKSPQEIYCVLYPLQCEQETIDQFNNEYYRKYEVTVEDALTKRLKDNPAQLEYALQLINKGKAEETDQTIKSFSLDLLDEHKLQSVAQYINRALQEKKPERAYTALTPFRRNTELLLRLDDCYKKIFSNEANAEEYYEIEIDLRSDIQHYLKNEKGSLEYALYLIGDQAMEKKGVSLYEARQLCKALQAMTFDPGDGVRIPLPFDYPKDGCEWRAYIMHKTLQEIGCASGQIIALSLYVNEERQKHWKNLDVFTNAAPDVPHGKKPTFKWGSHMALCIDVDIESGDKELRVLDLSLSDEPLTMESGMGKITKDSYKHIPLDGEYQEDQNDHNPPPGDYTYVFTDSHKFKSFIRPFDPPSNIVTWFRGDDTSDEEAIPSGEGIPGQHDFERYKLVGIRSMMHNAKHVAYSRLARYMREELENTYILNDENAQKFLGAITQAFSKAKNECDCIDKTFVEAFPNLYKTFTDYLGEHVSAQIVEKFKEYLCSLPNPSSSQ